MSSKATSADIILIDSDSESSHQSSASPPPVKKHKPNGLQSHSSNPNKGFANGTTNNEKVDTRNGNSLKHPQPTTPAVSARDFDLSSSSVPEHESASNESSSDSDANSTAKTSAQQHAIPHQPSPHQEASPSLSSDSDSFASDSSALQQITPHEYAAIKESSSQFSNEANVATSANATASAASDAPATHEASRRTIVETRSYLIENGVMPFLEKYLPATATSEDLISLILNLGFLPRNIPHNQNNEGLLDLIKLLHTAMKRVKLMRPRLENFYNIDHVLQKIESAKKILVITGAGISTSLGIPDFRSSKGFYSKLESLGLSDPQEVFDLETFHADPSIFYSIAYMILPPENRFSPLHAFIHLLQSKKKLLRNYTQNIDNLESYAGVKPEKLIQCHGSFAFATCVTCKYKVKGEKIFPAIRNREIAYCPKCSGYRRKMARSDDDSTFLPESFGVMKPDITFFGEALPSRFHDTIRQDLHECDLLISIGTSLKVAPVADIVDKVPRDVPQVLMNRDPIDHCNFDVSLLGYCDDVASYLCNRLGESWFIPHPDFNKIVGAGGQNLELMNLDSREGVYRIVNKETAAKEAAEASTNTNTSQTQQQAVTETQEGIIVQETTRL